MSDSSGNSDNTVFITLGFMFIGAGVVTTITMAKRGVPGAGIGMIGIGITYLIIGYTALRDQSSDDADDQGTGEQ